MRASSAIPCLDRAGATASYDIAAFVALLRRKYKPARIAAMVQVGLILWGWGLSQFPFAARKTHHLPGGSGAPGFAGTDRCNNRWISPAVSFDLVSDADH
jgi:hypothetical protein